MKTRLVVLVAFAGILALAAAGCSTQARAERKGKQAAEQICKAKRAGSETAAQRHLRSARDKLSDLARFTGHDVREDVRDLDRNLDQLSRGPGSNQDVNAIVRSVEDARAAAYDGMIEGLADCD